MGLSGRRVKKKVKGKVVDGDCGEIGGIKIGRGNRSNRKKPTPAPLCPPQIPHA
jgi:hypothetical protein